MESAGFHPKKPFCTLVLGTPKSGKTVLLASLYKQLSTEHPSLNMSFFISTSSQVQLLKIYHQLENEEKWPDQTLDFNKYNFTLQTNVKSKNESGDITTENCKHFSFDYYDIPGQSLVDPSQDQTWAKKADSLASKADSLIALIDGHLILKAIVENKPAKLYTLLDFILPVIQRVPGKPLHFVITKWDLLENYTPSLTSSEKLAFIVEILNNHSGFEALIDQQKRMRVPTRLVPVSSVGNEFASLSEDGMKINPRQVPKPVRVELLIVLGLIDGLRLAQIDVKNHSTKAKSSLGGWNTIKQIMDGVKPVYDNLPTSPDQALSKIGIGALITIFQGGLNLYISSLKNMNVQVGVQEQEMYRVVSEFIYLTKKLEIEFPASILADL